MLRLNEKTEKKGYSYNLMLKNMPFHIMTAEKYTFMYNARTSPYSHNYIESPPPHELRRMGCPFRLTPISHHTAEDSSLSLMSVSGQLFLKKTEN